MRRIVSLILVVVLLGSSSGCALLNEDKRVLTRLTSAHTIPEATGPRILAAPLWLPLSIVTLAVDALIVNPVLAAPAAVDDGMWAFTATGLAGPLELLLLPVRAVGFVGIFVGSEILRCTLPNPFG